MKKYVWIWVSGTTSYSCSTLSINSLSLLAMQHLLNSGFGVAAVCLLRFKHCNLFLLPQVVMLLCIYVCRRIIVPISTGWLVEGLSLSVSCCTLTRLGTSCMGTVSMAFDNYLITWGVLGIANICCIVLLAWVARLGSRAIETLWLAVAMC